MEKSCIGEIITHEKLCKLGIDCQIAQHPMEAGSSYQNSMNHTQTAKKIAMNNFFDIVRNEGYRIQDQYRGNNEPFRLLCPKGHIYQVRPASFIKGVRCRACAKQCPVQAEKNFRAEACRRGFGVIGPYTKSREPVQMECPDGHFVEISPNRFMRVNHGCKVCSGKCPVAAKKKFDKAIRELKTWQLMTPYVDSQTKLEIRCPKKHLLNMYPSQIMRKASCVKCLGRTHDVASKKLYENVEASGYKLLGKYTNASTKIPAQCNEGHKYYLTPVTFNKGVRCRICAGQSMELAWKRFNAKATKEGYRVLQRKCVNSITKVYMICPLGHTISMRSSNFMSGKRCGDCHPGGFNAEAEGFVYILRSDCGQYVKCGISNVYDRRISTLEEFTPFEFTEHKLYQFCTGSQALNVENTVKRLCREIRVFVNVPLSYQFDGYSEWYHLDDNAVESICRLCVKHGGVKR